MNAEAGSRLDADDLQRERRDLRIDFIDPLFAVVLGLGVEYTLIVRAGAPPLFDSAVLLLGFCNIILSWFGYHESIARKPIRGGWRFSLDVVILFIYLYVLLHYAEWAAVAIALLALFLVYWVWDFVKSTERYDHSDAETIAQSAKRRGVTRFYVFVAFVVVILALLSNWSAATGYREPIRWASLLLGYVLVFGFRFSKAALAQGSTAWQIRDGIMRWGRGELAGVNK
jgi:Ca2+/Na+ antiporter